MYVLELSTIRDLQTAQKIEPNIILNIKQLLPQWKLQDLTIEPKGLHVAFKLKGPRKYFFQILEAPLALQGDS